ncbi:hypothetical protein PPACK8108_LOCUS25404 [Phakopsora pachyrhizi]|uniref:Uncharacterized protein n=1 Tax=Phakopsora pachyrhizi TaxID=170000 RepID=A0AAV0BUM1_PHAPC|nr:hypothetical protein PPACK8108_LOCUS25404 [Phakopsora pachyrhizi]
MTTVKTIINNYQKQNQLKPQNHYHKLSPSDSSSSTSLSNSNNPSKKSNSNINIINQIYPASLISTSVNQFFSSLVGDVDHLDSEDPSSPYSCSSTPPNQLINRLIEISDQRINHLETKICSIKSDLQNFAAKLNSSSASSLLTSSKPTSPSIFRSQLASSNPRYGRHLSCLKGGGAYSIYYYYPEEPIIKTSTVSFPTSTSSAMTTPHEISFVSNQTTSTPTLKTPPGQPPNHQQLHQTCQRMMISLTYAHHLKLLLRIYVTRSYRLPLKSTKSRNITKTMCSSSAMAIRRDV